uniref:Uncharacterized protein n=1 Tax=Arundo donax TaxID=35708 RepID=A0A0A8ZXC1_ARUDO
MLIIAFVNGLISTIKYCTIKLVVLTYLFVFRMYI